MYEAEQRLSMPTIRKGELKDFGFTTGFDESFTTSPSKDESITSISAIEIQSVDGVRTS